MFKSKESTYSWKEFIDYLKRKGRDVNSLLADYAERFMLRNKVDFDYSCLLTSVVDRERKPVTVDMLNGPLRLEEVKISKPFESFFYSWMGEKFNTELTEEEWPVVSQTLNGSLLWLSAAHVYFLRHRVELLRAKGLYVPESKLGTETTTDYHAAGLRSERYGEQSFNVVHTGGAGALSSSQSRKQKVTAAVADLTGTYGLLNIDDDESNLSAVSQIELNAGMTLVNVLYKAPDKDLPIGQKIDEYIEENFDSIAKAFIAFCESNGQNFSINFKPSVVSEIFGGMSRAFDMLARGVKDGTIAPSTTSLFFQRCRGDISDGPSSPPKQSSSDDSSA